MDVGIHGRSFEGLKVCELDFLTNLGNLVGDAVADLAAFEFHVEDLLLAGEMLGHGVVEDGGGESDEVGVGGDEVGLTTHHDDSTIVAVRLSEDATFVGIAVGAFGGHFLTFLTEVVDSLVEVAVALYEGFFAIHHADTSQLTKLINLFCSDICHILLFCFKEIIV